jgi:nucleotide-binding universal stress UspA family protein
MVSVTEPEEKKEAQMYARRVVVGVDGSVSSALAVSWAADECLLRGTVLLIAHCPDILDARTAAQFGEVGLRSIDRRAEQILASFAHAASCRQPTVLVSSLVSHSDAPNALVDLSAGSELVVLGTHGHGLPEHGAGRLIVAQAHCPVMVVPNASRLDPMSTVPHVVHVVIDDPVDEVARRFAHLEGLIRGVPVHTRSWHDAQEWHDRHRGALFVVGHRTTDDHWSARLDTAADRLVSRMSGPVVVVGSTVQLPADHCLSAQ